MNPLKDKQLTYWLVNLGNMYYAGGLLRKKEDFSYKIQIVYFFQLFFTLLSKSFDINSKTANTNIETGIATIAKSPQNLIISIRIDLLYILPTKQNSNYINS